MIKGITPIGQFMRVDGGMPAIPSINSYHASQASAPFVGSIRYNTTNSNLEIFDGSVWIQYCGNYANVGLTTHAEAILMWAEVKMIEESRLKDRMEKHPGLKDAYERFKIMDILCTEDEKNATSV